MMILAHHDPMWILSGGCLGFLLGFMAAMQRYRNS